MQIRYCESCRVKLPDADPPTKVQIDLCEKCAGERANQATGTTPVLAQPTSRKSSATRLPAITTSVVETERPSRRTPSGGAPVAPSVQTTTHMPSASGVNESGRASSTVNMGFYFCEKCGKRVTEADLAAGRARNKQLRGIFCGACAEGALTLAFDAISQAELRKDEQNRRLVERRSSSTRLSASKDITGGSPRRSRIRRAVPGSPVLVICAVVAVVAIAAFLFMRSETPATAKPMTDSAAGKPVAATAVPPTAVGAPSTPGASQPVATNPSQVAGTTVPTDLPAKETPATVKPPDDPALTKAAPGHSSAPSSTSPTDAEGKAGVAFDKLQADLKHLPEDDSAGRAALYEAFLKKHGTTIVAARARAQMAQPANRSSAETNTSPPSVLLPAGADLLETVAPESKNYRLVYDLNLARLAKEIVYDQDLRATITKPFDRIAYFIELQRPGGEIQYLYVSMDAFTAEIGKIGVPALATGATFQQNLANMTVHSNVRDIVMGEKITGGNIEFWPNNYWSGNAANVPNAGRGYDFGDMIKGAPDGVGSMQIHNHDARQTLFAINNWKGGSGADIGIGNNPNGNPDWTGADNAGSYSLKRLRVLVRLK